MASPIRMAGETDEEYQRRLRPLFEFAASPLFRQQIQKLVENNSIITNHLKVMKLRESVGIRQRGHDTFKWEVTGDISATPTVTNYTIERGLAIKAP